MKNSKYQEPEQFFKYLIDEFGYSIFNDQQKCLAIASDMFECKKQVEFLLKAAVNNNVYITLIKGRKSSSEKKLFYIENAIKILTEDCGTDKEKATNVVGWLACNVYPNEWNSFIGKPCKKIEKNQKQTSVISNQDKTTIVNTSKNNNRENKNWTLEDINLEMIYCPEGSFMMGSPENELGRYENETLHKESITKPFMIGKYPVTQKQFEFIMDTNPSYFKSDFRPVEKVSWLNSIDFCKKLNYMFKNKIPQGYKFDLPTETQWEYACRAGTTTALNIGKNLTSKLEICKILDEVGWYYYNSNHSTHPVGLKKPNAWGIYDMHGNVWEWCIDNDKKITVNTLNNSTNGFLQVLRGGSWLDNPNRCRSATKFGDYPMGWHYSIGFRVALVPIK